MLELQPEKLDVLVDGERIEPIYVAKAIQHQLAERLKFVKPPDASVASLLFDYAAIEATTATLESAKGVLDLALKYGCPPDKVQPLMKLYDWRITWRKTKEYSVYILFGLLVVFLLISLYKRGIFVLSRRDLKRK